MFQVFSETTFNNCEGESYPIDWPANGTLKEVAD